MIRQFLMPRPWDAEARQAFLSGDFTRSQQLFEQELSAWRSTGRKEEIFYALHNIAEVMRYTPDYDPALARPFLEESMQVAQQIGTERYIQPAEFSLAWLDFDAGQLSRCAHNIPANGSIVPPGRRSSINLLWA